VTEFFSDAATDGELRFDVEHGDAEEKEAPESAGATGG